MCTGEIKRERDRRGEAARGGGRQKEREREADTDLQALLDREALLATACITRRGQALLGAAPRLRPFRGQISLSLFLHLPLCLFFSLRVWPLLADESRRPPEQRALIHARRHSLWLSLCSLCLSLSVSLIVRPIIRRHPSVCARVSRPPRAERKGSAGSQAPSLVVETLFSNRLRFPRENNVHWPFRSSPGLTHILHSVIQIHTRNSHTALETLPEFR